MSRLWSIAIALPAFYISYRYYEVLQAPLAGENRRWAAEAVTVKTLEFLLVHAGVFIAGLRLAERLWLRILGGFALASFYGVFIHSLASESAGEVVLAAACLLAGRIFGAIRFGGGTIKLLAFAFVASSGYVLLAGWAQSVPTAFGFTPEVVAELSPGAPSPRTMMSRPPGAVLFCTVWFFFVGLMEIARALPSPETRSGLRTCAIAGAAGVSLAVLFGAVLYVSYDRSRVRVLTGSLSDKPREKPPTAAHPQDKPRAEPPITSHYAVKPQIDLVYTEYGGEFRAGDHIRFRGKRFGPKSDRRAVISQGGLTLELEIQEWGDGEVGARIPMDPRLVPGTAVLQIKGFRSEYDSERVYVNLGRLFIEIREVQPMIARRGGEVTLRGFNFGERKGHQAEIMTVTRDPARHARDILEIIEWSNEAIRGRIRTDPRFVPGKYFLVVYSIDPYNISNRFEISLE